MNRYDKIAGKIASMSRYCGLWLANNGKWYMDLANEEAGERHEATTYGPFPSEEAADKFLSDNFSNPGGYSSDNSGKQPPPHKSPNGDKVHPPRRNWYGSIVSKIVESVKFDTKKEIQKYRQEHDITPGTKLQVRNQHEKEQRNKEKAATDVKPTIDEIEKFVHEKTRMTPDEKRERTLSYATRDHGNVGDEEPGEEDIRMMKELKRHLKEKFGMNSLIITLDTADEWVSMDIEIA